MLTSAATLAFYAHELQQVAPTLFRDALSNSNAHAATRLSACLSRLASRSLVQPAMRYPGLTQVTRWATSWPRVTLRRRSPLLVLWSGSGRILQAACPQSRHATSGPDSRHAALRRNTEAGAQRCVTFSEPMRGFVRRRFRFSAHAHALRCSVLTYRIVVPGPKER